MTADKTALVFLIVLFLVLNLLDIVTTVWGLSLGGRETNPLFAHYNLRGVTALDFVLKMAIAALMSGVLYKLYEYCLRDDSPIAEILIFLTLVISNLYYLGTVLTNISVLLSLME